jgi:hypothetical protein
MTSSRQTMKVWFVRFTALLALLTAAPGASELVREVVEVVLEDTCCGDESCDAATDEACSDSCTHCGSSVSVAAVSPSVLSMTLPAPVTTVAVFAVMDGAACGYRKPHLRPPTT